MDWLVIMAMFYQSIAEDSITTSSMVVVMVVGFGFSVFVERFFAVGATDTIIALIEFNLFILLYFNIKKAPESIKIRGFQRSRADSNRCRSFCRAQPSHSATRPFQDLGLGT